MAIDIISLKLIPYGLLLFSIIYLWYPSKKYSLVLLVFALLSAFIFKVIALVGLILILLLIGLAILYKKSFHKKYLSTFLLLIIFLYSLALASHLLPGFNNLLIFKKIKLSSDAIPYTMYLNFDKTLMGIILIIFIIPVLKNLKEFKNLFKKVILLNIVTIILIMCLSLGLSFIKLDIKIGSYFPIWFINNLFFVCLAEEALFRGLLQRHLYKFKNNFIAVVIPALIFGGLHYMGGISYVILATVSGLMYGLVYHKTKSIEMSVLTHALVNTIHIIFFTYPALAHF